MSCFLTKSGKIAIPHCQQFLCPKWHNIEQLIIIQSIWWKWYLLVFISISIFLALAFNNTFSCNDTAVGFLKISPQIFILVILEAVFIAAN